MDYLSALRAFVRAAELGSFSKAAEESGAKVSTVSRHIAALEADVGAVLFNRSTRRLGLTEAGGFFYERVGHILAELEEARLATASLNSHPQGLLKVSVPGAFGRLHVIPHLADFMAAYPDIRVDVSLTDAKVDLIETGADVAMRIGTLADSTLVGKRLAQQRRVVCASPRYLDTAEPIRVPADLARVQCLEFVVQSSHHWYFSRPPEKQPFEVAISGRLRLNDPQALLEAAIAGLGVGLLPTWLVGPHLRAGQLQQLLAEWEGEIFIGPPAFVWIVYLPKKMVSPKVRAFLSFFEQRFGRPPYWDRPAREGNSPISPALPA